MFALKFSFYVLTESQNQSDTLEAAAFIRSLLLDIQNTQNSQS